MEHEKRKVDNESYKEDFNSRLQHEDTRKRIIAVACDSIELTKKMEEICDRKIETFDQDLKIEAYKKYLGTGKYWVPIIITTLIGITGLIASL